jgi:putative spermidine/putrescine transport system substrate-binding protein
MKRAVSSWFTRGAVAAIAGAVSCAMAIPGAAAQSRLEVASSLPDTLTVFSQGDVNVQREWQTVLVPGFEKAYPGTKIKLVFTTDAAQNTSVYDEIAAAAKAGKMTQFDLVDGAVPAEAATANLLVPVNTKLIPNLRLVDPSYLKPVNNEAVPLRGSQVLIAYNSNVVKNPPKTLGALIAWIKSHPGKFAYCNPADGGSGEGFVQDVLSAYTPAADNLKFALGYYPSLESTWNKGFEVLKSIGADVFQKQYPNSNTGVLTLLASGAIDMGAVWSDMATEALKDGQLPSSIKLVGINPPMPGGPDYLGVPKNTPRAYQELAFKFINWALTPSVQAAIVNVMDGTPGIEFKYMPPAYQKLFAGYPTPSLPYSAKTQSDMERDWTNEVA